MKSVAAAAVLLFTVIFGGLWYSRRLESVSGEMLEMNKSLQLSLDAGSEDQAKREIEHMKSCIGKNERLLSMMGDHDEIVEIKQGIAELEHFTEGGNIVDAAAKSEVLGLLIGHLPENSRLSIENIL